MRPATLCLLQGVRARGLPAAACAPGPPLRPARLAAGRAKRWRGSGGEGGPSPARPFPPGVCSSRRSPASALAPAPARPRVASGPVASPSLPGAAPGIPAGAPPAPCHPRCSSPRLIRRLIGSREISARPPRAPPPPHPGASAGAEDSPCTSCVFPLSPRSCYFWPVSRRSCGSADGSGLGALPLAGAQPARPARGPGSAAGAMHSLDEPLDLKLSISKLRAAREKRERGLAGSRPRGPPREPPRADEGAAAAPPRAPGSPSSPPAGLLAHSKFLDKRDARFAAVPMMDLSLSPPSGVESPGGAASLSPERQGNGDLPVPTPHDFQSLRYIDGIPSSFQFFLPLGAGGALHLPSAAFLPPPKEKRLSPELPLPKQLVCRWSKCNQFFDLLQDLVDHVNDFHVKPEKDAGYCCHWEGCARHGRGFNARYKMLIHIRTHTNEKPHRCPTCNKSFSRLENLKIHNRSHTGEKPYICPYEGCNKRYSNSSDRFKHTRTHYVEKPYYCKMPGCHKRYTDPSSLRKHIKAHGHFVSHEHQEMLKVHQPPKTPLGSAEVPYVNGAQLIIPNPAALFGPHGLPGLGASLPIPLAPAPLDLSALGCGAVGSGALPALPSPVLSLNGAPLNLAKNPLLSSPFAAGGLGLPVMSLLAGAGKVEAEKCHGADGRLPKSGKSQGLESRKESCERTELARLRATPESLAMLPGAVLDLSTGVNSVGSPEALPPGWVVIPPGSVLLKPAVVN